MLYPDHLCPGDMVGVIAPAGPTDIQSVEKGIYFLRKLGLRVKLGQHLFDQQNYLAGTDANRLHDFNDMVQDSNIKAVIFARGGYGSSRMVMDIDYDLIARHPKIFWGYSDITVLHTAIRQQTGLVTFHGPMVASDIGKGKMDILTEAMFSQLFTPTTVAYTTGISPLHILSEGNACGVLVGGNLSVLTHTLATPYEINLAGTILLMEDINEAPYKVDAMLNQLQAAGKLDKLKGIAIGDFSRVHATGDDEKVYASIFHHYFSPLSIPVITGFRIGHCIPNIGVPLGTNAILRTDELTLTISPGVR